MKQALTNLVIGVIMLGAAFAPAPVAAQVTNPAPAPAPAPAVASCARPPAPLVPQPIQAASLTLSQMTALKRQREVYFKNADVFLGCVNGQIEARMNTMFATGAAMDPALNGLGQAHSDFSRERAAIYERFVRSCIAWEDRNGQGTLNCFE